MKGFQRVISDNSKSLEKKAEALEKKVDHLGDVFHELLGIMKKWPPAMAVAPDAQSPKAGKKAATEGTPDAKKAASESELVGIRDFNLGHETFAAGRPGEIKEKKHKLQSWDQWSAENAKRPARKPRVHFFTQLDQSDMGFVAQTSCRTSKLMGEYGGNFFVHGLNRSEFHHDGTKCDDCNWVPDMSASDNDVKDRNRQESNPTGSQSYFYLLLSRIL
jgi:hypothetical protein